MQNSHCICSNESGSDKVPVIRNCCAKDIPYLYEICLKTGASGKDATGSFADPYLLGQYYAAPYFFFQPEYCFVVENPGTSRPAGYILGTSDSTAFYSFMKEEWLPYLRRQTLKAVPASEQEKGLIQKINEDNGESVYTGYPAHLHIDILPELQGTGCGRRLVERMISELRKNGVEGVHLGVDGRNENAIGFYRKMGFQVVEEHEWGYIFGMKLV